MTAVRAIYIVLLSSVLACGDSAPFESDDAGTDVESETTCDVEVCNGLDDDCDSRVDEDFDLESDPDHCGACGSRCDLDPGTTGVRVCVSGGCAIEVCEGGTRNCDMRSDNGCESDLRELDNCGECGVTCELFGGIASCGAGFCELASCRAGFDNCDGRPENGCEVEVARDAFHCGACNRPCARDPFGAAPVCRGGACTLECDPGFADCDGALVDGCEQDLSNPEACGGCDVFCVEGELCSGGARTGWSCVPPPCVDPPTQCGSSCVDVTSNVRHCGGCGAVCRVPPNSRPLCEAGVCGFECESGFADCDGDPANGCEAALHLPDNCGACGVTCDAFGAVSLCTAGACELVGCLEGCRDCNADPADGCEAKLGSDPANCGACGNVCPAARPTCVGGTCTDSCAGEGCERSVVRVRAGAAHTCVLRNDATLTCWGSNEAGQLGSAATGAGPHDVTLEDVVDFDLGDRHTCAVTAAGEVHCWGANGMGQLGDGTNVERHVPTLSILEPAVVGVAVGGNHTCVIEERGVVHCWGDGRAGQLGSMSGTRSARPLEVPGIRAFHIQAGLEHTCAGIREGAVVTVCWGNGESGQLGSPAIVSESAAPRKVELFEEVVQLALGGQHSCAMTLDEEVWCWGDSTRGQLGLLAPRGSSTPVYVHDNARRITSGLGHLCVLNRDDDVVCWGDNSRGQLADPTDPMWVIPSLTGIDGRDVGAGAFHTCVVGLAGGVHCAGANDAGQLGDGTTLDRAAWTAVVGL